MWFYRLFDWIFRERGWHCHFCQWEFKTRRAKKRVRCPRCHSELVSVMQTASADYIIYESDVGK